MKPTASPFIITEDNTEKLVHIWIETLKTAQDVEQEFQILVEWLTVPITVMIQSAQVHGMGNDVMLQALTHYQRIMCDTILGHARNITTGEYDGKFANNQQSTTH